MRVRQRGGAGGDGGTPGGRARKINVSLVVGIELEKTVPGDTGAAYLGAAAWTGHEGAEKARYLWPSMLAQVADDNTTGATGWTTPTCRAIAQLNFANARRNPNAQTRGVDGPLGTRSPTTTTPTRSPKAGRGGSTEGAR